MTQPFLLAFKCYSLLLLHRVTCDLFQYSRVTRTAYKMKHAKILNTSIWFILHCTYSQCILKLLPCMIGGSLMCNILEVYYYFIWHIIVHIGWESIHKPTFVLEPSTTNQLCMKMSWKTLIRFCPSSKVFLEKHDAYVMSDNLHNGFSLFELVNHLNGSRSRTHNTHINSLFELAKCVWR